MSLTKKIINSPHGDTRLKLILILGQLKKVVKIYLTGSRPKDKDRGIPNGVGLAFSPELQSNVDLLATYALQLSRQVQLAKTQVDKILQTDSGENMNGGTEKDIVKNGEVLDPNDRE